jgi:hypothetical protein
MSSETAALLGVPLTLLETRVVDVKGACCARRVVAFPRCVLLHTMC